MSRFSDVDRQIIETCIRHNMGVVLAEATQNLLDTYDALRAELKAAKTDTARLDWMIKGPSQWYKAQRLAKPGWPHSPIDRAAIDAAREADHD